MICPDCTNGVVLLFTSSETCSHCSGTGHRKPAFAADPHDVSVMFLAYVEAALWTTNTDIEDDSGEVADSVPLDRAHGVTDLDPETAASMRATCQAFADAHHAQIEEYKGPNQDGPWGAAGYDLWLTQNGHGCGFWDRDRDWPNSGHELSEAARKLDEIDLYVGDDGAIYA